MSWPYLPVELTTKIINHLGVGEMAGVTALTKGDSVLTRLLFKKRVHQRLAAFHLTPPLFMDLLAESGALVSGSFALILSRCPEADFDPGDLDVYVSQSKYSILVQGLSQLGYQLTLKDREVEVGMDYAVDDNLLRRVDVFGTEEGPGRTYINVISVAGDNPRAAVFLFHSTIVMNYMDAHSLTVCYPFLTLRHLSLMNEWSEKPLARCVECWEKYCQRGVTFFSDCTHHTLPPHRCRSFNAAACYHSERSTDDGALVLGSTRKGGVRLCLDQMGGFCVGPTSASLESRDPKQRVIDALERLRLQRLARRARKGHLSTNTVKSDQTIGPKLSSCQE